MRLATTILLSVLAFALPAHAAPATKSAATTAPSTPSAAPAAPVHLESLRGPTPIDKTVEAESAKGEIDRPPLPRGSNVEPPLIPHPIRGYQITKNFNKCMDCHAWSRVKETGATKVSDTHYKDATGRELANISARRYVCTTCHVPQSDVAPLVGNTFQPAPELAPKKK
jgi:cytochrome c-type protein NapB